MAASQASRSKKRKNPRKKKQPRIGGTAVVYPRGVQQQLGISLATRWRMERDGKLPKRDYFVGGVAVGWKPETLEAAARGPAAA